MGRPKKRKVSDFNPTKQHLNAMNFCISNGIKIYPEMLKSKEFRLNIEITKDKITKHSISPKTYKEHELLKPIYEIYLTYFNRMAEDAIIKKSKEQYISFKNYQ